MSKNRSGHVQKQKEANNFNIKIENIKTEAIGIDFNDEYLKELNSYITKHCGIKNPSELLPKVKFDKLTFTLSNCYVEFANAIRRILIEELPTRVISLDEKDIVTDDVFILSDLLIRNVSLIPVSQMIHVNNNINDKYKKCSEDNFDDIIETEREIGEMDKKFVCELDVKNETTEIIDVKASDIEHKNDIIPNKNVIFARLYRNKHLKFKASYVSNYGYVNGCHCMLSNVHYEIKDNVKPYDIITDLGNRSITYDPTDFLISFTTKSNVSLQRVIQLVYFEFMKKLLNCKKNILLYKETQSKEEKELNYYYSDELEVHTNDKRTKFTFKGEYLTLSGVIAKRCYHLDPKVEFCTYTINRFDDNNGIVKIKHPNCTQLMLDSVQQCIDDVQIFKDTILSQL